MDFKDMWDNQGATMDVDEVIDGFVEFMDYMQSLPDSQYTHDNVKALMIALVDNVFENGDDWE